MKFSIGYQLFQNDEFINYIIEHKEFVYEVYFAWDGFANGRNTTNIVGGMNSFDAQMKKQFDLARLSDSGVNFNLLFNGTCYGAESQSRHFFENVGNTIDYVKNKFGLSSITTTSPLIAKFVKNNFPEIDVRASVNMCIGTVEGMEYVKDVFDSFYLKRELNRDLGTIKHLKKWCRENGKELYGLANSGCLNHCSAHTFHDNLVSHEAEISKMDNGYNFEGVCRKFLSQESNHSALYTNTNFIRPEDTYLYEDLFPALKLATRVNQNPIRVMKAYINKKFSGSVLDLLEPNHTGVIYPYLLENSKIEACVNDDVLTYSNIESALIKLEE